MKSKRVIGLILAVLFLIGSVSLPVFAQTGEEVLDNMETTMRADNKYMEQEMILKTGKGSERSRDLAMWTKRVDGSDKMLVRFLSPADVAGTGFLMLEDNMWLYLPALERTKRIAGSARQGDFMGSDMTYDDMESLGTTGFSDDYEAELLGETELDGRQAYQLRLVPTTDKPAYAYLEIWVDGEYWLPQKIEYYGEDQLLKTLETSEHEVLDGRWTAQRLEMTDHQAGSKTILKVKEVNYSEEIDSDIFTTRYLERGSN